MICIRKSGKNAEHISEFEPDILETMSNLSSDEVFTPPEIANKVLDTLPIDIWENPDIKILDPCSKSGVFLREAAKRLMKGLELKIPNEKERREHIFKEMLFGISITELTSLISRRSLYYSKDASNDESVVKFKKKKETFYTREQIMNLLLISAKSVVQ